MSHGDSVRRAPEGFSCHRVDRAHAGRGVRGPRPAARRRPVPPRGRHTAARPAGAGALPARRRGDPGRLDHRVDHRREQVEAVRAQIGDGRAICGLSGGVDSAVAAALVQRAIGDQLTCVFVDHGLLRAGEREQVERDFVAATGVRLHTVRRRRAVPRRARGRHRPRAEAQDHRPGVHPGVRGRRRPRSGRRRARRRSSCRARSTPTSSSPAAAPAPPTSSPTTTSAACRTTSSSSWSSRCARCSRTRCARSARSWGCPRRSSGASRSPGPGWASGSSARSPATASTSCAPPTPSPARS